MTITVEPRSAIAPLVTSPAPRDRWQACSTADPQVLPSQTVAWVEAMEATGDWRDASRHYQFADGAELVLPLVRRRGPSGSPAGPRAPMPGGSAARSAPR
ncbi:hypothetical protein ACE2AJ_00725 [Aquihabitans daechungensis]|uniref:hypothetical protein n=1 Tax=Aquihabitans daechungensis TaxID=1052257 RepID=UPI003B9E5ACF